VTALRLLDANTYLVDDILTKVDRATMANSLEARTPLLEHTLAEFVMTIPEERIYRDGEKKYLFKKAMVGTLPDDIIYRRKQGFSAPVRHWLRGELAGVIERRLVEGYAVRDGLFDAGAIRSMLGNFTENRWAKIWLLLMFEGWYRRWIHNVTVESPLVAAAGSLER
jgi:asparagine synthase (glutamine-hydrolysing)